MNDSLHNIESPPPAEKPLATDRLADAVVLLLVLTVVQRAIGFVRSILFCRWLSPEELGKWDLAFSFLFLVAPLAVLGIPGSFGRYAERYRQRGQLRMFFRRTILVVIPIALTSAALLVVLRRKIAWLVFDDPNMSELILLMVAALATTVAFNFLVELFTALRQMRVVSMMQFINTLVFAGVGIGLLLYWREGAASIVIAYGVACAISVVVAGGILCRTWRRLPKTSAEDAPESLWSKLLPFAAWVWVISLLANLFEVVDRCMIVHFSGHSHEVTTAMVGNYHSSRVFPVLMIAVTGLLSTMVIPHLIHDWEAGRRREVAKRLNFLLKSWGLVLLSGGVLILTLAPWIFGWALDGKYGAGLIVLPWTIVYCIWFSMSILANDYIWCTERTRLCVPILIVGLTVNISLNYLLLPIWGLLGVAMATAGGNAMALTIVMLVNRRLGMKIERATCVVMLLPLVLALGIVASLFVWSAAMITLLRTTWILSADEKQQLTQVVEQYWEKVRAAVRQRRSAVEVRA